MKIKQVLTTAAATAGGFIVGAASVLTVQANQESRAQNDGACGSARGPETAAVVQPRMELARADMGFAPQDWGPWANPQPSGWAPIFSFPGFNPSSEHKKGARPSTKGKHQKGQARQGRDARGGEKGDARRPWSKNGPQRASYTLQACGYDIVVV
jgi:hypothetical protein